MANTLLIIAQTIWFMLPAGIGNTIPPIAACYNWLPQLNCPLDNGLTWRGRRIFGEHKTVRGMVVGILFGSITGYFQHLLYSFEWARTVSLISYELPGYALLFGGLLGFGALAADALKSFLKRQLNVSPGKPWQPFDQIDVSIGALMIGWWLVPLTVWHVLAALIIAGPLSYIVSYIGVVLSIKKSL